MKDLTRYITREEVRVEPMQVRKGELLEKALAIAHRRLRLEYLDTSRVFNGVCGYIPLNRLPANGSIPDGFHCKHLHEAKNWNTKRYYIDRSKALSEIIPRGSNYPSCIKHLWVPKAKWQSNTRAYLIACGWHIHELPFIVTESNFELAVKWIMRELIKIYNLGYVNSLSYLYPSYVDSLNCLYSYSSFVNSSHDPLMMRRSTADRKGVMREPLLAEKLNSYTDTRQLERERKERRQARGGAKKPAALVHSVKEYYQGTKMSLLPSTQKTDFSYSTIYPIRAKNFLILLEIHDKVRTCMARLSRVRRLASRLY